LAQNKRKGNFRDAGAGGVDYEAMED